MKSYSRKSIAYYFLGFVLFLSALFGCSHKAVLPLNVGSSYSKSIQDLQLESSFGFSFEGHDYYFVSATTEGYVNNCYRFDGFKDDKLTYSFSGIQFYQLSTLYKMDIEIGEKVRRAVALVESFSPRVYNCEVKPAEPNTVGYKVNKGFDVGMNYLVYGSMAVIVAPIAIPAMFLHYSSEKEVQTKLMKIRLGDSYEKINGLFSDKSTEEISSSYLIQSFSVFRSFSSPARLLFVYKDKKVVAYVWGLYPRQ